MEDIDDTTDGYCDDTPRCSSDGNTYDNACAMWDFRISASDDLNADIIAKQLKKICKKYTFQLEKGEKTGYLHYQGRISLIKKTRKNTLMKLFDLIPVPNYLRPSANPTYYNGDLFYVMKEDTRVNGPWDERVSELYIPRQFRGLLDRLHPYQKVIWDSKDIFDTRTINLVYCPDGNKGKSTIASLCQLNGKGIYLPPVNDAEKLIQSCCDICEAKGIRDPSPIFIDMPRAMSKDKLFGIYSAVEQIKNGYLYDMRYKFKEYWIDSPQVWVFTNQVPNLGLLSLDRWRIWGIKNLSFYEIKQDDKIFEFS